MSSQIHAHLVSPQFICWEPEVAVFTLCRLALCRGLLGELDGHQHGLLKTVV